MSSCSHCLCLAWVDSHCCTFVCKGRGGGGIKIAQHLVATCGNKHWADCMVQLQWKAFSHIFFMRRLQTKLIAPSCGWWGWGFGFGERKGSHEHQTSFVGSVCIFCGFALLQRLGGVVCWVTCNDSMEEGIVDGWAGRDLHFPDGRQMAAVSFCLMLHSAVCGYMVLRGRNNRTVGGGMLLFFCIWFGFFATPPHGHGIFIFPQSFHKSPNNSNMGPLVRV